MTNRHVESFELLKQEVKGSFLLQVLVVPPFNQDNLRHHQLEENIQEDPGQKRSFTIATYQFQINFSKFSKLAPDEIGVRRLPALGRLWRDEGENWGWRDWTISWRMDQLVCVQ